METALRRWRSGAGNRFGLGLLLASAVLAAALAVLPPLAPWAGRAAWALALGLAVYLATVAVRALPARRPSSPPLAQVQAVRRAIAARLAERRAAEADTGPSILTEILAGAVADLDRQVPVLEEVVRRRASLG